MKTISMRKAKNILAALWLLFGGMLFFIHILQTVNIHDTKYIQEVWSWLLPTLMPSLTLILGSYVYENSLPAADNKDKKVGRTIFNITLGASIFYLITITIVAFRCPYVEEPLTVMKNSNLFLGPLQGLVSAVIGIFFLSKK